MRLSMPDAHQLAGFIAVIICAMATPISPILKKLLKISPNPVSTFNSSLTDFYLFYYFFFMLSNIVLMPETALPLTSLFLFGKIY